MWQPWWNVDTAKSRVHKQLSTDWRWTRGSHTVWEHFLENTCLPFKKEPYPTWSSGLPSGNTPCLSFLSWRFISPMRWFFRPISWLKWSTFTSNIPIFLLSASFWTLSTEFSTSNSSLSCCNCSTLLKANFIYLLAGRSKADAPLEVRGWMEGKVKG